MKPLIIFILSLLSFVPQSLKMQGDIDGVYEDGAFIVMKFDPNTREIITAYKNSDGEVMVEFDRLKKHINQQGKQLIFACNGGMFMQDLRPLGLYIENGRTLMPLNTRSASTNFYLQPNGVFYIMPDGSCGIKTTQEYKSSALQPKYATQSGPMLITDKIINAIFNPESNSFKYRNGVGVQDDGCVVFILSKVPVTFYEFAKAFTWFGCEDALFLDGDISDFYCPEYGLGWPYGYMSVFIAVVK